MYTFTIPDCAPETFDRRRVSVTVEHDSRVSVMFGNVTKVGIRSNFVEWHTLDDKINGLAIHMGTVGGFTTYELITSDQVGGQTESAISQLDARIKKLENKVEAPPLPTNSMCASSSGNFAVAK